MSDMEKMKYGAKQAIENCLRVKPDENVCIITDDRTYHIAKLLFEAAKKVTDDVKIFKMEDFGDRPKDGSKPLAFPDEIRDHLKASQVSIYVAGREKSELESFRQPMTKVIVENKIRHAHMIAVTDNIMETGMCVDYSEVQKVSDAVYDIVKDCKTIRVTTEKGTNFVAEFAPPAKWLKFDGLITKDQWDNLPAGEVFTCPENANGKVVVDGILGDYLAAKFGMVESNPVTYQIKDSRVVSIECNNKKIKNELAEYIKTDENADRIGEFGIGTNIGLKEFAGVMVQDEKFPGVHIAVGDPHGSATGVDWKSGVHCDGVIRDVTIEVDGLFIMKDGKYCI